MSSGTPRTDPYYGEWATYSPNGVTIFDLAQKLERENAALRKELDRHEGLEAEYAFALNDRMRERDALRKELEEAKIFPDTGDDSLCNVRRLRVQLAASEARNKELADLLGRIIKQAETGDTETAWWKTLLDDARAALKKGTE